MQVNVIGGGLAGCEAAYAIAERGGKVTLYDMKPGKFSPAHKSENLCELICSNSLKAERIDSAGGLLKAEMSAFNSVVCKAAEKTRVPAGGALAVDRDKFSSLVTEIIENHQNITLERREVKTLPQGINIIAAGPLVSGKLAEEIRKIAGDYLSFYDAASPIVAKDSINFDIAFLGARYGRGGDDYINCPMNKQEYEAFYNELVSAERAEIHENIDKPNVFEGCMPVEIMAGRGQDTLRFGPLKPVGRYDKNGNRPYAVVQLRQDNAEGTLYNIVGFQTNLKWAEQKRVFSMIPGLENAEFMRYGVMHRNCFIDSPKLLNGDFSLKSNPDIFFAGQITGVEGYIESAASGIMAGINALRRIEGKESLVLPRETMIGALSHYISEDCIGKFQPMSSNFGILPTLDTKIRDKKERYLALAERSLKKIDEIKNNYCKIK